MDTTAVTTAIGSLGFPIVACVAIAWYFVKQQQANNETIAKLSEALNNNTIALTKLSEKIESEKGA